MTRLTRLNANLPMVDKQLRPGRAFLAALQEQLDTLEAALVEQTAINVAQQEILDNLTAVTRSDAISASYTVPSTVLSASDAGSDATITVAPHTRKYGNATSLAVGGGSLTGLAYSTLHAVYYDDATRADTTPDYVATTDLEAAQFNVVEGRHFVGTVTTPAAAAPPTSGGSYPPGGGGGYIIP